MASNKNNVVSIRNNAKQALALALVKMEEFGKLFATGINARYEAAVYFGAQVKEKLATADDVGAFVDAYTKGTGRTMNESSRKTVLANFRAFAHPAVLDRQEEIGKAVKASMEGKTSKELGGKDLFAAAYGVNSKLKAAAEKKLPAPALALVVADVVKPKAAPKASAGADVVETVDPVEHARKLIVESATILAATKGLPRGGKAALAALLALKW